VFFWSSLNGYNWTTSQSMSVSGFYFDIPLRILLTDVIYDSSKVSGNLTLNNTNKLPNLYGFLWKGKPLSSTVIKVSGLITIPFALWILSFVPSKKSTAKSHPERDSRRVISFSIKRSAPFLLKTLCGYSFTTMTTSPASLSGCSSDSPWKMYFSPWGEPLSI